MPEPKASATTATTIGIGGGLLGGQSCRRAMGDDHIDVETNQVRKERRKPIIVAIRPAVLDDKIPSLLIAEITQAGAKDLGTFGQTVSSGRSQEPDPKDLRRWLLRARGQRPCAAAPPISVMNSRRCIAPGRTTPFAMLNYYADQGQCPLWVKSGHLQCKTSCPLYPRKRTCAVQLGMFALCQ